MDYSKITLIFRERAKLFTMRFIHPVSAKFIGQDCYNLSHVYLTDNYRRYRTWKRKQFYDTKVWQLFISIVAAVIASLITNSLLK